MSRRVGPGGRLRPAPRPHRNAAHLEPGRVAPFTGVQPQDVAVAGAAVTDAPDDLGYAPAAVDLVIDREPVFRAPAAVEEADTSEPFGTTVRPFAAPDRRGARPSDADDDGPAGRRSQPGLAASAAAVVADLRPVERRDRPPMPRPAERERRGPIERPASDRGPADRGPVVRGPGAPADRSIADRGQGGGQAREADDQPRSGAGASERIGPTCTAPQLRRFIKSRAYVPMHELRRRFGIDGGDDDVSPVDLESGRIFVGLPPHESQLLGDLLRAGEVGFELSMDPHTPIVVGVYSMRPVPRP